jgi:hypothetical protein
VKSKVESVYWDLEGSVREFIAWGFAEHLRYNLTLKIEDPALEAVEMQIEYPLRLKVEVV